MGQTHVLSFMTWFFILLTALSGAGNPVQAGANAELRRAIGRLFPAVIIVYLCGLLGLFLLALIGRQSLAPVVKLAGAPWWALTGGFISIAATVAGAALSHRLGSAVFTGVTVTSSLITSVVLDHYGLLGFQTRPLTWQRILGCGLMIGGLWIAAKF